MRGPRAGPTRWLHQGRITGFGNSQRHSRIDYILGNQGVAPGLGEESRTETNGQFQVRNSGGSSDEEDKENETSPFCSQHCSLPPAEVANLIDRFIFGEPGAVVLDEALIHWFEVYANRRTRRNKETLAWLLGVVSPVSKRVFHDLVYVPEQKGTADQCEDITNGDQLHQFTAGVCLSNSNT